jgi:DNA (cytosine-5)-methyltransferase 1
VIAYNELDQYAAQWLRNLSDAGHIAPGRIIEGSIDDIKAADLAGVTQFHTFAGIGVWSYALRLAGWPDGASVWTGSCPCQPFSVAGKRRGADDERHLWPVWRELIAECAPPIVFGEQVASPDGRHWLGTVRAEMEALGYAVGAADLCAAGVGAPHARQRLFFGAVRLADLRSQRLEAEGLEVEGASARGRMGDSDGIACNEGRSDDYRRRKGDGSESSGPRRAGDGGRMGDSDDQRGGRNSGGICSAERESPIEGIDAWRVVDCTELTGAVRGFWAGADWLLCRNPAGGSPKLRPVEPGTFPLAHGATSRVGRVRAYGNAIVPQVAAGFIQAFVDAVTA